nr:Sbal_3080 family lipoprotein [uncultured Desulfobacter sp.]
MKSILLFSFSILFLLSGCTAVTVNPVDRTLDINHVCIKDCSEECFDKRMLYLIQDGFQRHGITTEVYNGELPPECKYNVTYSCERARDKANYLRYAEIRIYRGNSQIGSVEYQLKGKGGFALNKWADTKLEIDPLIDELLSGFHTGD